MRMGWYDRVFSVFRFVRLAVPMFVLDILFQLHIFQPEWKGTMANDGAVADGLNSYKSFRPSAHKHPIVSCGLALKLGIRAFVENALFGRIFDHSIRPISDYARHREQNKSSRMCSEGQEDSRLVFLQGRKSAKSVLPR